MNTVALSGKARSERKGFRQIVADMWRYVTHYAPVYENVTRKVRVVCNSGAVWVMRAGDNRDYIVHAGETLILESTGRVLATALKSRGEAIYHVEEID